MTDREQIDRVATEVMGWHRKESRMRNKVGDGWEMFRCWWDGEKRIVDDDWNPFDDAWADKMVLDRALATFDEDDKYALRIHLRELGNLSFGDDGWGFEWRDCKDKELADYETGDWTRSVLAVVDAKGEQGESPRS